MASVFTKSLVKLNRTRVLNNKTFMKYIQFRHASAKLGNHPYELYLLTQSPPDETELTSEDALLYYKQMTVLRKMETAAAQLYTQKHVRGFLHLYAGQEACAVGVKAVMRPKDTVITSYRSHGWAVLMGDTVHGVLAELMGKVTGVSRGKGGSMHMYAKDMFGGNGIVGSHISVGTGLAFANKYRNDGGVSFTIFGDGAINQGQAYESFNIAKLMNLPVIYVIENNLYSYGTPIKRSTANPNLYTKGDLIPAIRVDGMDVLTVREATRFAIEHATNDKGPIMLEFLTYRYYGHSMSDPGTSYRTRDDVKEWRERSDPITTFSDKIIKANLVTEDELKKLDHEAKKEVDQALEQAKKDPVPNDEELVCDVYNLYPLAIKLPAYNTFWPHKHVGHKARKA